MLPTLMLAAAIALVAMIVRGMTGFGSALIAMPLLLLVLEPRLALVADTVIEAALGVALIYQVRRSARTDFLVLLLPLSLLGVIAGSAALLQFDSALLKRSMGAVVSLFALRQLLGLRGSAPARSRWPRSWGHVAGLASGVLGALFGTAGPPVVIFLENQIDSGAVLRGTLIAFFAVLDSARLGSYALNGIISPDALMTGVLMLPTAFAGNWIGTHMHLRMNEKLFRAVVGGLLLLAGLLLVIR
ncbi:MAG: sulfite exporter TauE/SafE family protein [Chloroflexi bacterium]|nr:sulfite exporter TauE/SafE family protein [Chloroflexota bacterium]